MKIVFSQRHKQAIDSKKLPITLSRRAKQKIFYCMKDFNVWYGYDNQDSILYDDLKDEFLKSHGITELFAYPEGKRQNVKDIESFILYAWAPHLLDSIELYNLLIPEETRMRFAKSINLVFRSEDTPYRLLGDEIILLDSNFLESEVLSRAYELLEKNDFEKACKDFLHARDNFTAKDFSGTIFECNNALESALKKVLDKEKGDQKSLKSSLMRSNIIPEYFQGFCDHFDGLLQSCFTIANFPRHGKKEIPKPKNIVDPAVASFVLHLTGALLVFIMERYEEQLPKEPEESMHSSILDDDIPF